MLKILIIDRPQKTFFIYIVSSDILRENFLAMEYIEGGSNALHPRTTDIQRELFFKNSKLLGLGRQIGLKFWGAFWLFLLALFWHWESLDHGKV